MTVKSDGCGREDPLLTSKTCRYPFCVQHNKPVKTFFVERVFAKKAEDFVVLRFVRGETSEEGRGEEFRMSLVVGSYCYQLQERLPNVTFLHKNRLCNTLLRLCGSAFARIRQNIVYEP